MIYEYVCIPRICGFANTITNAGWKVWETIESAEECSLAKEILLPFFGK